MSDSYLQFETETEMGRYHSKYLDSFDRNLTLSETNLFYKQVLENSTSRSLNKKRQSLRKSADWGIESSTESSTSSSSSGFSRALLFNDETKNWLYRIETAKERDNEETPRVTWVDKMDFIWACAAQIIGVSNMTGFSINLVANGGIIFLIPTIIWYVILGLPIVFLEIAIGQYTSDGPISIWNCAPLFKGLGGSTVLIALYLTIFGVRFSADFGYFAYASAKDTLPLNASEFNTSMCFQRMTKHYHEVVEKKSIPYERFKNYTVIERVVITNFAVYFTGLIVLALGIPFFGRWGRWKMLMRFLFLLPFVIYTLTLPGAFEGIAMGLRPDAGHLGSVRIWLLSMLYVIWSLSLNSGTNTTLAR